MKNSNDIKKFAMSAIRKKHAVVSSEFNNVDDAITGIEHRIEKGLSDNKCLTIDDEKLVLANLYRDFGLLMTALSCLESAYDAIAHDKVPNESALLERWLRSTQIEMRRKTSCLKYFRLI